MIRWTLLRASESRALRRQFPRLPFARRAVRRFMPGEELEAALEAARLEAREGLGSVLTHLGEDVESPEAVEAVVQEYLRAFDRIEEKRLDMEVSVKPTQLGLLLGPEICREALLRLARRAVDSGRLLWIDMEGSDLVEGTLAQYRGLLDEGLDAGLCLQAYLHRTPEDLAGLLPSGPAIRLVKGAYREPAEVALTRKSEVDARFLALGIELLEHRSRDPGVRVAFGTHDGLLIDRLREEAERLDLGADDYEFQLLYGIRSETQRNLARDGVSTRVLISYGEAWFPWYMRRLAERPANLVFLVRALLARGSRGR